MHVFTVSTIMVTSVLFMGLIGVLFCFGVMSKSDKQIYE